MLTETAPHTAAATTDPALTCRLCGSSALRSFLDLGATPPCELFLPAEALERPEVTYPLHVRVCESCLLAQLPPLITPEETFTEYAYFSSFSSSWVEHARRFVDGAVERLGLDAESFVVEVASNDGYLLQHVVARGIRCVGIEPSVNVGEAARGKGVPTFTAFLTPETGAQVRAEHGPAQLVCLNNVYAHIPDVVGFTKGLRSLVADDGWVSIEVQHLLTLVERTQFDTIYHEHFQYYTVLTAQRALASGGLALVDVELLDTHGGSVRLWARPVEVAGEPSQAVREVLAAEQAAGLHTAEGHDGFADRGVAGAGRPGRFPDRGAAGREDGGGLRRAGQGQHAVELLRYPAGSAPLHGRPQSLQAWPVHSRYPDPGVGTGSDRGRSAGLRAGAALESPRGVDRAVVLCARLGGPVGLPDPDPRGGLRR